MMESRRAIVWSWAALILVPPSCAEALDYPQAVERLPPVTAGEEPVYAEQLQAPEPAAELAPAPIVWTRTADRPPCCWPRVETLPRVLEFPLDPLAEVLSQLLRAPRHVPAVNLSPWAIGIQPVPARPRLLLEWNELFLGEGRLGSGIELPTGAVWRPAIWVFGSFRTGYGYADDRRNEPVSDWANRLDLFGQLNLSGSERLLVGLRPLDEERGRRRAFTGYDFVRGNTIDAVNSDVQTLFFEGQIDELFPGLDPVDRFPLDLSIAVGRQPLSAQQGLLINEDRIDALVLTRNYCARFGSQNVRISGVYAWDEVHRHDNQYDPSTQLYGLLCESDWQHSTMNLDVVYARAPQPEASLVALGLSSIRRIVGYSNTYNVSLHTLASFSSAAAESAVAGQGELLFGQFSWQPKSTNDIVYLNTFWAIDQFTSPARGTLAGGPLGQVGLAFSAASLGRYGPALSNQARSAFGGSIGYQMFFDSTRQQVTCELGGRWSTRHAADRGCATTLRYQAAIGPARVLVLDSFLAKIESFDLAAGVRCELTHKF